MPVRMGEPQHRGRDREQRLQGLLQTRNASESRVREGGRVDNSRETYGTREGRVGDDIRAGCLIRHGALPPPQVSDAMICPAGNLTWSLTATYREVERFAKYRRLPLKTESKTPNATMLP